MRTFFKLVFFFFLPSHRPRRSLLPQSPIEPMPLEVWGPNHWTAREVPLTSLNVWDFRLKWGYLNLT